MGKKKKNSISPSRMKVLDECQRLYFHQNEEGRSDGDRPNSFMIAGSLIHRTIQLYAERYMKNGDEFAVPKADEIGKQITRVGAGWKKKRGETVVSEALALAVSMKADVIPVLESFSPEMKMSETWWSFKVSNGEARGIWDRVDFEQPATVRIWDYKTGGDIKSKDELILAPATLLYLAAARQKWPDQIPIMTYWWVNSDIKIDIEWTPELHELALVTADAAIIRIAANRESADWPADIGNHCKWCAFKDECQEYLQFVEEAIERAQNKEVEDPYEMAHTDLGKALNRRQELKIAADLLDARRKDYDKALRPYAERNDGEIANENWSGKMISRSAKEYPSIETATMAIVNVTGYTPKKVWNAIAGVKTGLVEGFLKTIEDKAVRKKAKEAVEATCSRGLSRFLKVTKVKTPFG